MVSSFKLKRGRLDVAKAFPKKKGGILLARNRAISRENKNNSRIEQETNYYLQISAKRFNSTHTSAVEAIVLLREIKNQNQK